MLANKLMSALTGGAEDKLYVDDVFSTYLYTGNGSTQTIDNGIDLAGEGGLVWLKHREGAQNHGLFDTERGAYRGLYTNITNPEFNIRGTLVAFNSNGFTIGSNSFINSSGGTLASWTFRRAPKFFDVVTYIGDGAADRQIPHRLGITPGMITSKSTSVAGDWTVYHRSAIGDLDLSSTNAQTASRKFITGANDSTFTVSSKANSNGVTYVAYLFAHDDSEDGIIQCGSYKGNGGVVQNVNLGWEPQYVLVKNATNTANWWITDAMRGFTTVGVHSPALLVNMYTTEEPQALWNANATGFTIGAANNVQGNGGAATYIYLAIRRPNKPPETGAEVYNAIARTGTGAATTVTGVGFAPDLVDFKHRTNTSFGFNFCDKLRSARNFLVSGSTAAESYFTGRVVSLDQDGITVGTDTGSNASGSTYVNHFFRRAPGFFDVVCYTGTGVANSVFSHSLGVQPELAIIKRRDSTSATGWIVGSLAYQRTNGNNDVFVLNSNRAVPIVGNSIGLRNSTESLFRLTSTGSDTNANAGTYVAYLFASLPGISKVGYYTGNGTGQVINCGFTTGARFILIKRTDDAGDWHVWDTARGIVADNDPHLSLNTTAAEVTTDDSVDPHASGFIVNQVAATNINVSGGEYIFLAIA